MDDPIKVIFKYKNNNRRIQHHIYVFVGIVPTTIMTILKKFTDKSLFDTFMLLAINETKKLENYYGVNWYRKFFNTYHINYTIHQIKQNSRQIKELTDKYGKDWYTTHIEGFQMIDKNLYYTYETLIKDDRLRKEIKKKRLRTKEDDVPIDYTTKKTDILQADSQVIKQNSDKVSRFSSQITNSSDIFSDITTDTDISSNISSNISTDTTSNNNVMYGGDGNVIDEDDDNLVDIDDNIMEEDDNLLEFDDTLDMDFISNDEDINIDELEKVYQDMDVAPDSNILQTSNLIKIALKDDKLFKKTMSDIIEFDTSKDNLMYDENLRNVYQKHYIIGQYIFKDDTIKMVKNKICCSIKNNIKFGKNSYIIPSRQYLYSEYFFNNSVEKVMIGQKWIRRTDLLKIDVEPNNNMHIYEELRGNLKLLRDNIKRYGSKIKREDDDFNIMYDYEGFYTNNEMYMTDIYNDFGLGYNPDVDALKNVIDVYVRIYYPRIKTDDIKYVIDYLNNNTKIESNKLITVHETINNDMILENQIMNDIETIRKTADYTTLFKDNYITQSVIHVNLRIEEGNKLDLFRIFNEFIVTDKYPFIQYQTQDGQIIFKYKESDVADFSNKKDNIDVLSKWFENAPYGISFKVKIVEKNVEKFMGITLNENARIEYKTQWKEEDMATIEDIRKTYDHVKDLIKKINSEKNKITLDMPENNEFKYAFINSIQKFVLPEKFTISHNDLSEFSRYFFPYIALVIEPRKRQSKIKKEMESSKFGTYLRYKRVSKYENQNRIEQRVLYFMRNYDYNDQSLSNEISKQFNITLDRAMEEIERVRGKYPNIKRSRKILKKLENIPKYKPPGIGIDIQGKQRDRYKIRISGARDKEQLDRIINFMNILIYLYVDTYLYKIPERQVLKEKLKKLTNIAKRRNKVDEVVNYEKEIKKVKQMAALDKKRLGFKPEKGQNQWSRSCQNSGTDKKRQPQYYTNKDQLENNGFKLDKKTGIYEKVVKIKGKRNKTKDITIRAVGLGSGDLSEDGSGSAEQVYYYCSPKDNGEHMYVGFLSRSNNPYGQCMPCCFKKDAYVSKNKAKRDYFLKCIGKVEKVDKKEGAKVVGDQLYILQDTNKIQEGRFGFLPKYLDFYFNQSMDNVRKIKHHYLLSTSTGYYFKFGSKQDEYQFLNAISTLLDISVVDIKNILINKLENDKSDTIFTALNNGDIKTRFGVREKFISFINTNNQISFELLNHFISLPNVLKPNGINIIVFNKHSIVIKKTLEKEKVREDFTIMCQNNEEYDNMTDISRETLFLIKENKNFYPIVMVIKKDEAAKNVDIKKIFKYDKTEKNIVHHVIDFYNRNCQATLLDDVNNKNNNITAKQIYAKLVALKNKDFKPRYQIIDARNKCKYLITENSTIIPTTPSGSIYNLSILKYMDPKILPLSQTIKQLETLYKLCNKELPIKPIGVYFLNKQKNNVKVMAIMTELYESVPVVEENVTTDWIDKNKLIMENKQLYDKIDEQIKKGTSHVIDNRIQDINYDKFYNESYELFRLELSNYLNNVDNNILKKRINKIIDTKDIDKKQKRYMIRKLLYRNIEKNLYNIFEKAYSNQNQTGGKFIHVISKTPNVTNYIINNNRDTCDANKDRDTCNVNQHCRWSHNNCFFALTREMIINFVNKVSEELANGDLKAYEILKKKDYFVSDIVDYNKFTQREDQKIIKSTNTAINKVMTDLFGKENIPKIGRRKGVQTQDSDIEAMNMANPLKNMGEYYVQKVMDNNLSIYRAYANGYGWIKHAFYDLNSRNLGYYSGIQTDLSNYFRSIIIDWLNDKKNRPLIEKDLLPYMDSGVTKNVVSEFINKISRDVLTVTNGVVEYYILSKYYKIPIIVYNEYNTIIFVFDDGLVNGKKIDEYKNKNIQKKSINIKFIYHSDSNDRNSSSLPVSIETIYFI
jgi:hypothetical protein